MGVIKNCLTMIGLFVVLMIGGCALTVRGCAGAIGYNPTVWSEHVDEEPGKTRRMLADFLRTATWEQDSKLQVRGSPTTVTVQDYTDGSIHLTLDRAGDGSRERLVEVVTRVTDDDGGARVEVISDATALAHVTQGSAPALHRRIRSEFERALEAIDQHHTLPPGFSMARLIRLADSNAD